MNMRFLLILSIGLASTLASVSVPEHGKHGESFKYDVEIKNIELDPKEELSLPPKTVDGGMFSSS